MADLSKCYRRNENLVFRRIGDETILVPIRDNVGGMGFIYNLNETAGFVWEHLDGERSLLDIQEMLVNAFDVEPKTAQRDLSDLIEELEEIDAVLE
jgi:hypothetical protein